MHAPAGRPPRPALRALAPASTPRARATGFAALLEAEPRRRHRRPETTINPIPREWYHTDWVADRTIAWLDSLADDDDWFCG